MKWPTVELGNIAKTITKGTTPLTAGRSYVSSGIPFLRVENLLGGEIVLNQETLFIDEETDRLLSRSRIFPGDVLLSIAGTIGRGAIVGDDLPQMNCNQAVAIIRILGPLDKKFLLYWFKTIEARSQIHGAQVTLTISNLSLGQIKRLQIPLPPLSEQRRIVEILDKADALRKKRTVADAKTKRILPALFMKMFGDPVTNPKGWPIETIEMLADVQGGLQLSPGREALPLKMPYLRVANVYRDRLSLSEIKTIGVSGSELERVSLALGDVLVVEGHGNPEEIGRTAVWDGSIDPCVHQNHLIRVRPDSSRLSSVYLSRWLNSVGGRKQLISAGKTTSGLNTISVRNVKAVRLPVPPIELQSSYARLAKSLGYMENQISAAKTSLEGLFASLLHRAFSGDLTAKWREAHMKELLVEMEEQARYLNSSVSDHQKAAEL
jgi:type I restriction enzyme, S subunit